MHDPEDIRHELLTETDTKNPLIDIFRRDFHQIIPDDACQFPFIEGIVYHICIRKTPSKDDDRIRVDSFIFGGILFSKRIIYLYDIHIPVIEFLSEDPEQTRLEKMVRETGIFHYDDRFPFSRKDELPFQRIDKAFFIPFQFGFGNDGIVRWEW